MNVSAPNLDDVVTLFKADSPFEGQQCFASFLNEQLGRGIPLSEPWERKAAELDMLIVESKLEHPKMVFRATIDPFISPHIRDTELIYPAFMSTSTVEEAIERHFSGPHRNAIAALLKIECPPQACAFDMEKNPAHGGYEHELLLPRNARFDVVNVTETSDWQAIAAVTGPFYASSFRSLKTYLLKYKI